MNPTAATKKTLLDEAWKEVTVALLKSTATSASVFYSELDASMGRIMKTSGLASCYTYGQLQKLLCILLKYFFVHELLHNPKLNYVHIKLECFPAPIDRNTVRHVAKDTGYTVGWDHVNARLASWLAMNRKQTSIMHHETRKIADRKRYPAPLLWEMAEVY